MSLNVVLLAGAGAVESAWVPVLEALRKAGYSCVTTAGAANLAMAQLTYLARMTFYAGERRREVHTQVLSAIADVRRHICEELTAAQQAGAIRARPQLYQVMNELVLRDATEYLVATTNWDSAVDEAVRSLRTEAEVEHLHGSIADGRLYLPTEAYFDEHRQSAERSELSKGIRALRGMLERAHRVVFYGLGLGSEDVELGALIGLLSQGSQIDEFCVVDPDYARVAERLRVLLVGDASRIPIRCYCPCDVEKSRPVLELP